MITVDGKLHITVKFHYLACSKLKLLRYDSDFEVKVHRLLNAG